MFAGRKPAKKHGAQIVPLKTMESIESIDSIGTMDSIVPAFTTTKHTGAMIPVFAYGPGSEKFAGIYENTAIFDKMLECLEK